MRQYLDQALALYEELQDKRQIAFCLGRIGVNFALQQKHMEALPYFLRSLHLQEEMGDKRSTAMTLLNIASSNFFQNKIDSTLSYHQRAFRIHEELDAKDGILLSLNNLGFISQRLGKPNEAIAYSLRAVALADSLKARQALVQAYNVLSLAHDSLGQHKIALEYFRRATAMNDSLVNEAGAKKTAELQAQYDVERKDNKIKLLQKDKDLQALQLLNQANALAREHAESERRRQTLMLINNERQLQTLTLKQQEAQLAEAHLLRERDKQALALAEKDKSLKDAELGQQTAELRRQRVIQWSLASILLLALVAAVWLGNLYRQKRRANDEILRQQAILQDQAAEIELMNTQLHESNLDLDAALKDLKAAQTQLVQSERMSAIGMLTAGVMHEINNPNAIISSAIQQTRAKLAEMNDYFLSLLDEESKDSTEVRKYQELSNGALSRLELAADGAGRVKTIVANLQGFTKHQENSVNEGDWVREIRGTVALFAVQYQDVAIHLDLPATMGIQANFGELNQVLLNVLVNAAQSGASQITVSGNMSAMQAVMRVADNGSGMSAETAAQIFEPFFTTKGVGNSGLGLSIVKKIVEAMNGRVWCESELGKGATFIVELPKSP